MALGGLPLLSRDDPSLSGGCSEQLALEVGHLTMRVPWWGEAGLGTGEEQSIQRRWIWLGEKADLWLTRER